MQLLSILLFVAIVIASGEVWRGVYLRWRRGQEVVDYQPRRPVPWGLRTCILVFATWIFLQALAEKLFVGDQALDDMARRGAALMGAVSAANIVLLVVASWFVVWASGATASDLGWPSCPRVAARDVWLGARAFALAGPPVYLLNTGLSSFVREYRHPLLEVLQQSPSPALWLLAALSAVIAAPLVEEFIFRLILQGLLEKAEDMIWQSRDESADRANAADGGATPDRNADAASAAIVSGNADANAPEGSAPPADVRSVPQSGWLPILISAAAFAAMHAGQGLAPVPLFFLAIVLGYLYRQTHRIVPCIALHMMFNGFSLLLFGLMSQPDA